MTHDSDYAYIDLFIDFLERIISMIKGLFGGLTTEDDAADA